MERETVLKLIAAISPMAEDYVRDNIENTIILYSEEEKGVFLKAVCEGLCVYYAKFPEDSSPKLLQIINDEMDRCVSMQGELCFNVQGRNRKIIELVQRKGFTLDMEGYILKHDNVTPVADDYLDGLTVGGFNSFMCDAFVELFESAYERMNLENGWDATSYSRDAENFCNQLKEFHEQRMMQAFWDQIDLVGCYIIDGPFIKDIVVHPHFQNKGYGSLILRHCIRFMREEKGISEIFLRVTKSNEGAKRLYERNGFRGVSYFAEHTYHRAAENVSQILLTR